MAVQEKILGQVKIASGATPESLYSPSEGETGIVVQIVVCETGNASATFSIYVDADGSDSNAVNTLYLDQALTAKQTQVLDVKIPLASSAGNIMVEASTTDVVFTAMGYVVS